MPKPCLIKEDAILEDDMINTLYAGLKEWRADLDYPESYSDMQACVRGLLRVYTIKRKPLPTPLRVLCPDCKGLGERIIKIEPGFKHIESCERCKCRGYIDG